VHTDPEVSGALLLHTLRVLMRDPWALGGAWIRAPAGPERTAVLDALRTAELRMGKVPTGVTQDRLLGGLDVPDTLRAGAPVYRAGIIEEADGGWLTLFSGAYRMPDVTAPLLDVLDRRTISTERRGQHEEVAARVGLLLLDEPSDSGPPPPDSLLDRIAFWIGVPSRYVLDVDAVDRSTPVIRSAPVADPADALTRAAHALGVASLRAPSLALRAARLSAEVRGAGQIEEEDVFFAARAVLAPRATVDPVDAASEPEVNDNDASAPSPPDEPGQVAPTNAGEPSSHDRDEQDEAVPGQDGALPDRVVASARAILPELRGLFPHNGIDARGAGRSGGQAPRTGAAKRRGRVRYVRPGDPREGRSLDLFATLRSAAPWQSVRGRERGGRLVVLPSDLRVRHLEAPLSRATIFVVDGSGSHAVHRLAEAKGAVELHLAESYVRREEVALVVFRGRGAELVLPLTRSLARARRVLSGLPGGGGTPLAAGLMAGLACAEEAQRRGASARLVVLTDGKANVGLDGQGGRERAMADTLRAARAVGEAGTELLLLDTSPRGNDAIADIARAGRGSSVRLPQVTSDAVRNVVASTVTETRVPAR
jgi:magnesium chelatase subunit D